MHLLHLLGTSAALQLGFFVQGGYGRSNAQLESVELSTQSNPKTELMARWKQATNLPHTKHNVGTNIASTSPCAEAFEKPKYRLSEFQFNKTTTEAGDRIMTHFQLYDVPNNGSLSCTTPYLQDSDKPIWNDCNVNDDAADSKTIFKYTASTHQLELNQMWICEVQNKTHPHPYFSSAKMNLTGLLDCVDDTIHTKCTIADDAVSQFSGDYVTPVWKSGEVDVIPPSQESAKDTPWNPTPCIGLSFSYPNWDIQGFFSERNDEGTSVHFRLNNHANNQSVMCEVQGGEWSSCNNSTDVRFDEESKEVSVNQTWVCNESERYPEEVTFRAIGSASFDGNSPVLIKGSLTEPIELTPNVAPEGVNHPACLETSETPSWIITSWMWNEKWRNGYNSGDLTVTFYNPSTGFNLTCKGDGEELNRDGRYGYERWWGCALASSPFDDYRIISLIKLNPVTEVFSIDQRWSCNGHDSKLPAKFKAVGDTDTTLECSWSNDTSTNTFVKTCRQAELPLTVHGNVTERTELPRDVFFELDPSGYSCTIASVLATQWRTTWPSDTVYAGPTFAGTFKTKAYFGITFAALDGYQNVNYRGISLTPFLPTSEPGRWYDCKDYEGGEVSSSAWARNSLDCKWQLDLATGYFAINHTWFCDDKDPENPIVFRGSGSRYYDFSCYIYREDHEISCSPTGLNPPPVLPTYLSWERLPPAELASQYSFGQQKRAFL